MNNYKHSVSLDAEKCCSCTMCLHYCPTEAIRIKDGRANIKAPRCIDCGECIRKCPYHAKKPIYGKFERIKEYKWTVALPDPSLYGQFDKLDDVDYVLNGLLALGFDDVYEVAQAAELFSAYTRLYLKTEGVRKPVISSACPAVVRLIGIRFPSLAERVLPILPPMEVAAQMARKKAKEEHPELADEEIGLFFISPCPAKVSYVGNKFEGGKSNIDEVISISDIYFMLLGVMNRDAGELKPLAKSGKIGIGWASTGGESSALLNDKYLAADGIENVIHVLDLIETGNMPPLEYIELSACPGGCVGGVMNVANPYMAKAKLQNLRKYMPVSQNNLTKENEYIPKEFFVEELPQYEAISKLSDNIGESIRMMAEIQRIRQGLPGINCGTCGAPSCRAFAEDIVKGETTADKCIMVYRKQVEKYIKEKKQDANKE
ncbi:MAG: ferredoxin [Clostridia bacterium]|nr:ferredoxin [Clostridia bacterium]